MKNYFDEVVESSRNAIKYWWLMLLVGIATFAMGIVVFAFPADSYLGMSVVFGWLILFSGVTQIFISASNRHYVTSRGWMLFSGIIETVLGLILIFSLSFSTQTLPLFLGFWLLFKSFGLLGLGSDMVASGWTVFTAVMLMIVSLIILVQPIVFGVEAVILWVGVSLIFGGVSVSVFAFQLRDAHKAFEK